MKEKKSVIIIMNIIATVVVLLIFLPIIVMIPSMFKGVKEIFSYPWHFFAQNPTLDNFRYLAYLEYTTMAINYFKSLFMTILVAAMAVLLSLSINMVAAFAFARLRFPLKKILWASILFTMFIPGITILITSIRVVSALKMLNTIWVLVVPGLVNAYNMFFFRQFFLNIPKELDEAAKIDGANPYQTFRNVTLPLLSPTIFFVVIITAISSFQVFDLIYLMTQGGPFDSTNVLVYDIYKNAFEYFNTGRASAIAYVLFAIILVLTLIQWSLRKKLVYNEID